MSNQVNPKEIPKRADKAISLLEGLIDQLHYFYNGDELKFKQNVLKDATEIENILKDLSVNKKETFRRISKKYEEYYKNKSDPIVDVDDTKLNESIRQRYKDNVKKD